MPGSRSPGPAYRIAPATDAEPITRAILATLPEWFGRPEAVDRYVAAATRMPTLLAYAAGERAVGFVSLKRHTPVTAEVHVIGVKREDRGRGCGRQLLQSAEERLRAEGVRWLTVKTLAATHPDPFYAQTRLFYEAMGFEALEVFDTLWGEDIPCLLMMKPLRSIGSRGPLRSQRRL